MKKVLLFIFLFSPALAVTQENTEVFSIFVPEVKNATGLADYNNSVIDRNTSYIAAFNSTGLYKIPPVSDINNAVSGLSNSLFGSTTANSTSQTAERVARNSGANYAVYIELISVKYSTDLNVNGKVTPGGKRIISETANITIAASIKNLYNDRIVAKTKTSIPYKNQYTMEGDSIIDGFELTAQKAATRGLVDAAPEIVTSLTKQMKAQK